MKPGPVGQMRHTPWQRRALIELRRLAETEGEITTRALLLRMPDLREPPSPGEMGAVMNEGRRRGWIELTGEHRRMRAPNINGRTGRHFRPVYRSLLWKNEAAS